MDAAALVPTASTPTTGPAAPMVEPEIEPVSVPPAEPPTPPTQEYCNTHYGQPVGEVFTWRGFSFQKYLGDAACESHRQGAYLGSNVAVDADGDLVISARRHCPSDVVGEDSPTNEAPCLAQRPQYSVGRVRLVDFRMAATDFEWGFEAWLPERSAPGARGALWLVNLDQIYCDPLWGELDVVEWYSSRPDRPEAATHATCNASTYASWHHKAGPRVLAGGALGGFHRWAVRKQTTHGTITLSYLYDDHVYATDTCEQQVPAATCAAVLDRGWTAILQTAVFGDASGVFTQPAADEAFPTQELVIRSMWITPL
jgi:hypothetical protein